jgi:hypothetical protein
MNKSAFYFSAWALCLACIIISCDRKVPMNIPKDAKILGETTVADVDGFRVGSGNYYQRVDARGVKRTSIQIFIWRPGNKSDKETRETVVFEGDEFTIGDKKYRLLHVDEGKGGDTGKAFFVPVK